MSESALERFRQRQPGAPLYRIVWWYFLHFLCYCWVATCYHYRSWYAERIPREGPVLIVSNHQSFLDPILVGLSGHHRQFYAMARSTLFEHPLFRRLIRSLNAIPVERGTSDMAAMRTCIDILNKNQALLIFPEGTRTLDGTTKAFATGTMLLVKRGKPRVVPVAVEGSHAAWPKGRKLPRAMGRIGVMFGEPIDAETLIAMGPETALEHLRKTVEAMRIELVKKLA